MAQKAARNSAMSPRKRGAKAPRALSHFKGRPRAEKDGTRIYSMHDLHKKSSARVRSKKNSRNAVALAMAVRLPAFFAFAFVATMVSAFVITKVDAATFQGPTSAPPGSNIPVTIWNRAATTGTQTNAAIDIDGNGGTVFGINVGGTTSNLGAATVGQNLIYGVTPYANTNPGDMLLKLQTLVAPSTYTNRFTVDRDGNVTASGGLTVGALTTNGNLKSNACFGGTLVGLTPANHHGSVSNVGNYYNANALCNAAFAGSHVCQVAEILESIKCAQPADPIRNLVGQYAWLNGGPPGDPAKNANDCQAWTDNSATTFGRIWIFNNTTGGAGTLTSCNVAGGAKYACCK